MIKQLNSLTKLLYSSGSKRAASVSYSFLKSAQTVSNRYEMESYKETPLLEERVETPWSSKIYAGNLTKEDFEDNSLLRNIYKFVYNVFKENSSKSENNLITTKDIRNLANQATFFDQSLKMYEVPEDIPLPIAPEDLKKYIDRAAVLSEQELINHGARFDTKGDPKDVKLSLMQFLYAVVDIYRDIYIDEFVGREVEYNPTEKLKFNLPELSSEEKKKLWEENLKRLGLPEDYDKENETVIY